MASNTQSPGHDGSPAVNQIPLQDLSRAPDGPAEERGRGRANSAGGGLFSRHSLMQRGTRRAYQNVAEESPIDTVAASANPFGPSREEEIADDDRGDLAQAMLFGISFNEPRSPASLSGPSMMHGHDLDDAASDLDNVPLDTYPSHDPDHYMPQPDEDDTARLTDPRYLQPISGAGSAQDRQSGSKLGHELPHLEDGLGHSRGSIPRSRSLSPSASSGALQRASSMVKSMSQRVVNLSNEPEVVQQSIEREEHQKSVRLEGPPILPTIPDDAHDPTAELPPREKRASGTTWKYRNNPFRGRSLGIFGPNHTLRLWLCDILVHPFTEPFILAIIIIQTILLIVESARSVFDRPVAVKWGSSPLDYVFFVIFVIYTLEIVAKMMVSGFLFNPVEYSTLNRSLGLRNAIAEKGKNLITPHRQMTSKKSSFLPQEPQASILRTFTGMNAAGADPYDDPHHKRRFRLAHRAFLRHSFNRLDFVAVVAYWISFFLSLDGVETSHQLYIFRMLSCLRILRLLALTNGTSVCSNFRRPCIVAY